MKGKQNQSSVGLRMAACAALAASAWFARSVSGQITAHESEGRTSITAAGDVDADGGDSSAERSVESIVVRVGREVDEFSRLSQRVRVALPPDFKDRVKALRDLAVKGQEDDGAAANFHESRSALVGTLSAAMNETLGQRAGVNASIEKLSGAIQAAKREASARLLQAESDIQNRREKASLRQTELQSISADAWKIVATGKTLPLELQNRIRLAAQHQKISAQAAATAEMKARVLRQIDAKMRTLSESLAQQKGNLDRYYDRIQADRQSLDAIAEIGGAQTELAQLKWIADAIGHNAVDSSKQSAEWNPLLDFSGDAEGASAVSRDVSETNSDDVLAIINANVAAPTTRPAVPRQKPATTLAPARVAETKSPSNQKGR